MTGIWVKADKAENSAFVRHISVPTTRVQYSSMFFVHGTLTSRYIEYVKVGTFQFSTRMSIEYILELFKYVLNSKDSLI